MRQIRILQHVQKVKTPKQENKQQYGNNGYVWMRISTLRSENESLNYVGNFFCNWMIVIMALYELNEMFSLWAYV